jgi:prevent-host-death family protein
VEYSVPITEFRDKLKEYLDKIIDGQAILLTKRGKVVARILPESVFNKDEEAAYKERLQAYKSGGIKINDNIVDQPMKPYEELDDSLYSTISKAAEPDE